MHSLVRSRLRRIYVYYGVQNMLVGIPVIVLYLQEDGITLGQFFLLQSIYSVLTLILEVPSGYLSDKWKRTRVLSCASVFTIIGTALYGWGDAFAWYLIAEIFYAFGSSFISGTTESLVHDTLLEEQEDDHSRPAMRQLVFLQMSAQAAAALLTGFVAAISLQHAILARLPFMMIAFVLSFTLHEPIRTKLANLSHYAAMKDIVATTFTKNIPLRGIIIISSLISMLTLVLMWMTQSYQGEIGLSMTLFGVVQAVMLIGAAVCAKGIKWFEKQFDDRLLLIAIAAITSGAFLLLALPVSMWGFVFLFLGRSMYGAFMPLTTDLINHLTTSDIRATVLSLRAVVARLTFAILGPIVGYLTDILSLTQAFLWVGICSGFVFLIAFFSLKRVWKLIPDTPIRK